MPSRKPRKAVADPTKPSKVAKKPANGVIKGNTSRDHIYRIFVIFSELQNKRYPDKEALAELCGCSTKTIERDLDSIRGLMTGIGDEAAGAGALEDNDIVFDHAKGGYRLKRELSHFPIIRVEDQHVLTLHFLRQCLEPYKETGIGRMMIDSFNHTFGILTGTTNWKDWERAVHFRFEGKPESGKEDVKVFDLLHKAILDKRVVSIDYKPAREERSTRLVEPLFLFMRNGSWYLYCRKAGKPERRTLKFARISNARLTDETFKPLWMDPKDSFRYSFGVVPCETKARKPVVIEFTKESAQRAGETVWHPEQKIEKLPGGGVRLTLPFDEPTYLELKPWILSWGASAKVIGPRELKEQVEADIRRMAEMIS